MSGWRRYPRLSTAARGANTVVSHDDGSAATNGRSLMSRLPRSVPIRAPTLRPCSVLGRIHQRLELAYPWDPESADANAAACESPPTLHWTRLTLPQIEALAIIAGMLVLFVTDRLRYDLVAALALSAAVLTGVVPAKKAFEGFSSPVIIIIASVLVISRAVAVSGVIDNAMRRVLRRTRFHHAADWRADRRGDLHVRLRQERRRTRRLHACRDPGRRTAQPPGVALPDAARLRFTDRRHHHPDRHLAQRADLDGAPGGHGPAVSPVRLHSRRSAADVSPSPSSASAGGCCRRTGAASRLPEKRFAIEDYTSEACCRKTPRWSARPSPISRRSATAK